MEMSHVEEFLETRPHLKPYADLLFLPPSFDEVACEYPQAAAEPELYDQGQRFVVCDADNRVGLTVLALYAISRTEGSSHSMAMMLALRRAPGVETTDTFWAGRKRFDQVYGEFYANTVKRKLAEQGVHLGYNDEYMPEFARFQGDPEAVVSFSGIRSEIKSLCQRRGWGCNGAVTVEGREPEKDPHAPENCVPLAPSLIREHARKMITKNPDLKRKSRRELTEMVVERHGPSR